MVLIKAPRVARYVQQPDPEIKGFLLHGTDAGLVRVHGATLCEALQGKLLDKPEVIRFNEDELIADPALLAVEAHTVSMFSPSKLLRARTSGRAANDLAKFPWHQLPGNVRVVIEAGNLKPDAKLRKLFESEKSLAALACHDGGSSEGLVLLIRQEMTAAGLHMKRNAETHLAALLSGDLGVARSELVKLVTYSQGQQEITVEDIDAVIGDAAEASLNAAVHEILTSSAQSAFKQMDKLKASGTPPDVLLYALSQQLMRLLQMRARMDAGSSLDAAARAFRPPLHFRRVDEMKLQMRSWTREQLKHALERVSGGVHYARRHPEVAHQTAANVILELEKRRRSPAADQL
jgi:DNA polymerase III subunit delta